jgi:hypothetical protein
MSEIITGLLGQISDGERVRTYLLTTAPYHDPALASLIEYGTALAVIPENAGMSVGEEVEFQPQGGSSNVSISQIPLINTEGEFDDWGRWILAGLEWTWGRGYADQPWENWFKAYFKGAGKPEFRGRERVMITLRNWFDYMSQPVARQVFSEDDVSNTRLINTTVPLVFGSAYQVKPLVTEPQIQRYAVAANANDIPAVQEGGNPATPVYEPVPLGFQLFQSPSLELTCDVTGPALEGWEENDVLSGVGDFEDWASGLPDGWDVTEDAPYAVISETVDGYAKVENTAKIDGDTGWITGTTYAAGENYLGPDATPVPDTDTLADVVSANDTRYARMTGPGLYTVLKLTGSGFDFGLSDTVEPVGLEARVVIETAGGGGPQIHTLGIRYPDGFVRGFASKEIIPGTKTTLDFGSSTYLPVRLTRAILEDPGFEVFLHVRNSDPTPSGALDIRVYQIALKVHYGTVVDRLRLTTKSDVMTVGNSYLLRITTEGGSGDSIKGYWGSVSAHSDDIPSSDNPYAQTSAQLESADVHEFRIVATGKRFAIEFDRGDGNGEQVISSIQLIDKSASRERFKELQRYIHELFGQDPDEVCDNTALELVQTQAGNPRLGWYVDDQTTAEQLSTLLAHSLGAAAWGGLDKKWTAGQMRVPQQPDGEYLSVVGSFGPRSAYPDTGEDLRDRVHAARNVHPLRDSETANVTTTWPEDQRQLVLDKWRITEKADWSNLVGFPTLTVTGIDPATGDTAGGTTVTITGTGFEAGATVTIGGNAATNVAVVSSTEITCDTPASDGGATGAVAVVVTVGGQSVSLANGFDYSSLWTPESDSGLVLWQKISDASSILLDGSGNIEQIGDKSGNAYDATQSNASKRPATGTINGLTCAVLDGSSTALTGSTIGVGSGSFAVFEVVAHEADSASSTYRGSFQLGEYDSGFVITYYPQSNRQRLDLFNNGAIINTANGSFPNTGWGPSIIGVVKKLDTELAVYKDATELVLDTSAAATAALTNEDGFTVGYQSGVAANYWKGKFGERVVTTDLSQGNIDKIWGYLAHEWGLESQLPSGHPYKNSPP